MNIRRILFLVLSLAALTSEALAGLSYQLSPATPMVGEEVMVRIQDKSGRELSFDFPYQTKDWGDGIFSFKAEEVGRKSIKVSSQDEKEYQHYQIPIEVIPYQKQYLQFLPQRRLITAGSPVTWDIKYSVPGKTKQITKAQYRFDFEGDGQWDTGWENQAQVDHVYDGVGFWVPTVQVRYPDQSLSYRSLSPVEIVSGKDKNANNDSGKGSDSMRPLLNIYRTQALVGESVSWELDYPAGDIYWDADGDGGWENKSKGSPSHQFTYYREGRFYPRLKIVKASKTIVYHLPSIVISDTDSQGSGVPSNAEVFPNKDSKQKNTLVTPGAPQKPEIKVLVSQRISNTGEEVSIDASSSQGANIHYYWEIDGKRLSVKKSKIGVRFRTAGTKKIKVLIEDERGQQDKVVFEIQIKGEAQTPLKSASRDNSKILWGFGTVDSSRISSQPVSVMSREQRPNGLYAKDLMQGF